MRRLDAVALLLAWLTACDDDSGWERGADSPLSPRWGAAVGWTGTEVIVTGGVTTVPYPPGADYATAPYEEVYARDGRLTIPRRTGAMHGISVVGTDLGPVVTAEVTVSADHRAEVFDGDRWRRFPDPIVGGVWWHWTGERLVDPDPQVGDGTHPAGGVLDVDTGTWSPLPDAPSEDDYLGWRGEGSDGPLMVGFGYLYDDRDGSWTPLPRLSDALTQASGVVADHRLVVFGGFDDADGYIDNESGLSADVWVLDLRDIG